MGPQRKAVVDEIMALEAALAALPGADFCADVKAGIELKIQDKKREITNSRPIGARVDACRAWLDRCAARRLQCADALELAQETMDAADAEVEKAFKELAALEDELAANQSSPKPVAGVESGPNCIEAMAGSLHAVLSEMQRSSEVPQDVIQEAEAHMKGLMDGIARIAAACAAAKRSEPGLATPVGTPSADGTDGGNPDDEDAHAPRRRTRLREKARNVMPYDRPAGADEQGGDGGLGAAPACA